jgi:Xaa-Pro aminopeptidase
LSVILLYGDTASTPNIYYTTRFVAPDPFIYARGEAAEVAVVPTLEKSRAAKESRVSDIRSFEDMGYQRELDATGNRVTATLSVMERLIRELGTNDVVVEPSFPVIFADGLRQRGVSVTPDEELFVGNRRRKGPDEIDAIAKAQRRAEQAIASARNILAESVVLDGALVFRGVPLTAERLRGDLEASFVLDNFGNDSMIVAPGPGSADPHWIGSGPIRAGEPLILDIFPQDRTSRYYGDVTRTFVKGQPDDALVRMFESVRKAQSVALDMITPGVNGRDVHNAVVASFAEDGYDDSSSARYTHGTGHGLGLEVHELPSMGRIDFELREGDVVTVEPGLYDPSVGGVRLEDVVVVEAAGSRNLNSLPKELVVG